jgi:BirA family transcriptional regulator, biotin operon repressor / biotin---[acetyl-CoA-carboxylase] ligase
VSDALLALLAGGEVHSGQDLAAALGMTRAAVWKQIESLRRLGVEVDAVRGRGYRLARPVELLDSGTIQAMLTADARSRLASFGLFRSVDSTNARLLAAEPPPAGRAALCIAEYQTAGRGRRGRTWVAPLGSGLCLSVAWRFATPPPQLGALGLAAGVGVAQALHGLACGNVRLKWPNDLVADGDKLGGILTELQGEMDGPAHVVCGVGINVDLPARARARIAADGNSHVTDVRTVAGGAAPGRNALAAAIGSALIATLARFEVEGFAPFRAAWSALDALAGADVVVTSGSHAHGGRARGVDHDGALLLERDGRVERVVAGEATVRRR